MCAARTWRGSSPQFQAYVVDDTDTLDVKTATFTEVLDNKYYTNVLGLSSFHSKGKEFESVAQITSKFSLVLGFDSVGK